MVYDNSPGAEVEYSGTVERQKDQEMDMGWHQWSAMSIVINQQSAIALASRAAGEKQREKQVLEWAWEEEPHSLGNRKVSFSFPVMAWSHSNGSFLIYHSLAPEPLKNLSSFFLNLWFIPSLNTTSTSTC